MHAGGPEDELVAAPQITNNDVVRTRIAHTNQNVVVRVKFRELRRRGEFRIDYLRLVTNEGVRRDVSVWAGPESWRGEHDMTRVNGKPVECAITHSIDYGTNVVRVWIPRSCLHNPRWVRVGLGTFWVRGDTSYVDDAFLDGAVRERGAVLSPRVRRG